jgi:glutamyl-tRNA synthetase
LVDLISPRLSELSGQPVSESQTAILREAMGSLKDRAKTLVELSDSAAFYLRTRPLALDAKAAKLMESGGKETLALFAQILARQQNWRQDILEDEARRFAEEQGVKLGQVAQPLRVALTGSTVSPPIFEVMRLLGRDESLARIQDVL